MSRSFKLTVLCVALTGAALALLFSASAPAHDGVDMDRVSPNAENGSYLYPPLSRQEVWYFLSDKAKKEEREVLTIQIITKTDVSRIRHTGAMIMTEEPDYVVALGDKKRIDAVKQLGLVFREPKEADLKLRFFSVWITTKEQLQLLIDNATDVFPPAPPPSYVSGRIYDMEVQFLRDLGFEVKILHGTPGSGGAIF